MQTARYSNFPLLFSIFPIRDGKRLHSISTLGKIRATPASCMKGKNLIREICSADGNDCLTDKRYGIANSTAQPMDHHGERGEEGFPIIIGSHNLLRSIGHGPDMIADMRKFQA